MFPKYVLLLIGLILNFLFYGSNKKETPPVGLISGWDLSEVADSKEAFVLVDDSTSVSFRVDLLVDDDQSPVAYTSYFTTPVCDDTLCALMHIRLYWNLIGNYVGYDTLDGFPLTKNDHIEFTMEDYEKLHKLLMDDNSIIKRKDKKELFDDEEIRTSKVVDAVTGATAKEVKEAVVDGALYSSYTLYHIVYGEISEIIRKETEEKYSTEMEHRFMLSGLPDYELYALQKIEVEDLYEYKDRLPGIIKHTIPLNRIYIFKKMPKDLWEDVSLQVEIFSLFFDLDLNSQSFIMNKLKSLDSVSYETVLNLADKVSLLTRNQLKVYISILQINHELVDSQLIQILEMKLSEKGFHYGYLLKEYVESKDRG